MTKFTVTNIQFFDTSFDTLNELGDVETVNRYSANVVIDDKFIIQCSGGSKECNYSIPTANECHWNSEEEQNYAYENYELNDIVKQIEDDGFENSEFFLEENQL